MNIISRGFRNAFRNTIRTGSIVIILALSIGLIIAMLAARQGVNDKINSIKSSAGNTVTISPAGVRGFEGGGTALTETELSKVAALDHVTNIVETLSDRLTSSDTSLESAIEAGSLGERNAENSGVSAPSMPMNSSSSSSDSSTSSFTPPIQITGVNNTSAIASDSSSDLTWSSGEAFDASSSDKVAVMGKTMAEKNNLSVGDTFTAYDSTFKVVGIYDTGNTFDNNSVYIPLATLQSLSDQAGDVTSATVTVDSTDNLASVTTNIKSVLGDAADVTNDQDKADTTTSSLSSVASIALFSLIGALVAGAIIILLTMLMIVRERRREIGVMKAIGASNLKIMWQFVVEALTLTVMGLIIGTGIGILAATPLTNALVDNTSSSSTNSTISQRGSGQGGPGAAFGNFSRAGSEAITNIQSSVGATILLYGLGSTLLIAILGSAIPSLMISKIKPADAMRNE